MILTERISVEAKGTLDARIRRGVAWSTGRNLLLRLAGIGLSIVLARLLTPQEFGTWAVALTVSMVLLPLADLGLTADIIRSEDPLRIAPTVATIGLVTGSVACALMYWFSTPIAQALGSPDASQVISLFAFPLLLSGAGVVPVGMLMREFDQRRLFWISAIDFAVYSGITVVLATAGKGAESLGIARISASAVSLILQYIMAQMPPKFGFDRRQIGSILRFGLPLAGANLLSTSLFGVDKLVISRTAGATRLGYYVMAFNISTWPMSAVGEIVRSVATATFARVTVAGRRDTSLAKATAPTWALAVLVATLLGFLAKPLIQVVYGSSWLPAATVLAPLAMFGAIRVAYDLFSSYLQAKGRSISLLSVQIAWFAILLAILPVSTTNYGIAGAAYAHLLVSVLVAGPAYVVALKRAGADMRAVSRVLWQPVMVAVPTSLATWAVSTRFSNPLAGLSVGLVVGTATFALLLGRWFVDRLREARFEEATVHEGVPGGGRRQSIGEQEGKTDE